MGTSSKKDGQNPFVGIAGVMAGALIPLVIMPLIFAKGDPNLHVIIIAIIAGMTVLGSALGYFALKKK